MLKIKKLFTLIELIVVIVILGILAAIVVPNISSFKDDADQTAIVSNERNIQTSVDLYVLKNNNSTPTNNTPIVGNPQKIDFNKLNSDYLRSLPKTKGVKYWLDYNLKVSGSTIDAPKDVNFSNGTLSWSNVKDAVSYNVYKTEESTSSLANNTRLLLLENIKASNTLKVEVSLPVLTNGSYLVSAIDNRDFETPAVNGLYKGYEANSSSSENEEDSINPTVNYAVNTDFSSDPFISGSLKPDYVDNCSTVKHGNGSLIIENTSGCAHTGARFAINQTFKKEGKLIIEYDWTVGNVYASALGNSVAIHNAQSYQLDTAYYGQVATNFIGFRFNRYEDPNNININTLIFNTKDFEDRDKISTLVVGETYHMKYILDSNLKTYEIYIDDVLTKRTVISNTVWTSLGEDLGISINKGNYNVNSIDVYDNLIVYKE